MSFLNVLSVLLFFPETRARVEERFVIRWGQSVHNIYRAFTTRGIHTLFITSLLFQGGLSFLFTFFSVYLIRKFSFTQGNIGDYFAYIGLWVVITQAVVTRAISKRFPEALVLRVTLLGCAIATFCFFLPSAWWGLLVVTPFFAINNGLTQANMVSLISRSADSSIQGEMMGINASVQAIAQAVPPILSGLVASQISPEAPIIISSLIVGASWLFFMTSFRREQTASRVQ
ncbi:hypothetical protein A2973_00105 [Candidatus Gottesmanbacteria bacterium RIFCSPLOWO2_01_FULL_49_10]|uniref:Major facilitator superfamily (MFS) profile domain-containing protein n=1 Tax=Candidatus Gottesmanbacteria bacterium RIFCSPLOWO2_01_FULL_49_10 TaxID=1798396 RepID=A0A1F6B137_9BACT|nr:MAG: hypothetical protein A2973_00105 [Candidatus Gottesmanbacteria bacterium RIFCSPLOWO2_01_FULL_49_10]